MDDSNQRLGVPPYYVVPQPQDKPEEDQVQGPKVEQQQQGIQQPQELQQPQREVSQQQYNPFGFSFSPQVQLHPEQQQLAGNAPHPAPHPYMQYPAYYPPTGYGGHPYQFSPQQYGNQSQVQNPALESVETALANGEGSSNTQPGPQPQLGQQPQFQHPQAQQSLHHGYAPPQQQIQIPPSYPPPHQFSGGWVPPGYYPHSFGGQTQAVGGQSSSPDPYLHSSSTAQSHQAGSSSSPAPPQFDQAGGQHAPAYPSPPPPPPALTTEPMTQPASPVPKAETAAPMQSPSAAPASAEPTMPGNMETAADEDDVMQDVQEEQVDAGENIASTNDDDDDDIAPISPVAAAAAAAAAAPASPSSVQPPQQQQDEILFLDDNYSTAPPLPYGPGATDPYFLCSPETARLHKRAIDRNNRKMEREAGEDVASGFPQVVNIHDVKHTRVCVSCKKSKRKKCDRQWPCDNCCKHDRRWNECQYALTDEVTSESEDEGDGEGGGVRGGGGGGGGGDDGEMIQGGGPPIPAVTAESENTQPVPEQQVQPVAAAGPALNVSLTQDQLEQLLASNPAAAQLLAQMQAVAGGGGE